MRTSVCRPPMAMKSSGLDNPKHLPIQRRWRWGRVSCATIRSTNEQTLPWPLLMPEKIPLDDAHWKVLRLLEINPRINQRELAAALGVSLGKVNYCLKALLEKGLLKIQNFQGSKRKLAYAYVLTPAGIREKAALTGRFLKRKVEEYELLKAEIESLQQEINKAGATEKSAT